MKCEKCKQLEGYECVYYHEHEGYLCKPCYKDWLKIAEKLPNQNYKLCEEEYLKWISS